MNDERDDKIMDLEARVQSLVAQVDASNVELKRYRENADFRQRASDQMYSIDGMKGFTKKLTIKQEKDGVITEYDLYLHTAYFEGVLNFINITCHGSFDYSVRRLITMVCDHVRRELRHSLLDEEQLIKDWQGTIDKTNSFEPQGTCEQIPGTYLDKLVASPLDAAAKWLKSRRQ
jgi:hypothetical protein